jgi:hypothetical protein
MTPCPGSFRPVGLHLVCRPGAPGRGRVRSRLIDTTRPDDEFLARTEPFAEPREGGLEHGASRYAEGLRRTRAQRRASRHNKRRDPMHKAYAVAAGVMSTAVVAAAVFAILAFAGVFSVSPGMGGGDHTQTLVKQASSTTTDPPSPSTTTAPPSPGTDPELLSPDTAAQTGRSPLPPSNRVATPHTTAGAKVPAPSLNSNGSQPLSSASSPPVSGAPAPAQTTARTGSPTCHGDHKKSPKGQAGQPSRCSRS